MLYIVKNNIIIFEECVLYLTQHTLEAIFRYYIFAGLIFMIHTSSNNILNKYCVSFCWIKNEDI